MLTTTVAGRATSFSRTDGATPALVGVHGAGGNHHAYGPLFARLPRRQCVAVDLPGRLGTTGPALESVADMASFILEFIDKEVQEPCLLAGHSLGGAVALEAALQAPDKLAGIVLLATGARLRVHPTILQLFEAAAQTEQHPPSTPGLWQPGTDPAFVESCQRLGQQTPPTVPIIDWRAADAFDRMSALSEIQVPALVVSGGADALTPVKYGRYLADHMPDALLVEIRDAGHMLIAEEVDEVVDAIEAFAAGLK